MRSMSSSSWATYPPNSWPSVSGTASWRWVRPVFTMSRNSSAFTAKASRRAVTDGISRCTTSSAAAMCIAVGKVSFAAGELDGPVRDHLVDVHVRLRAAARLPDVERELVVVLAVDDLVGGLHD